MSNLSTGLGALRELSYFQDVTAEVRGHRWNHGRMCWDDHVEQLVHEGMFNTEYRMSLPAHGEFIRILDPILERAEYNSRCTEPI